MNTILGSVCVLSFILGISQYLLTGCISLKGLGQRCDGHLLEPLAVLSIILVMGIYLIASDRTKKSTAKPPQTPEINH